MLKSNPVNQTSFSQFLGQFTMLNSATRYVNLPSTRLFGTDGIRGKVGEDEVLNPALAARVGFWTGQILQTLENRTTNIIVGQDSRNSSNALAMAVSEGLAAAGVEVWNLGLCPTSAVAYLTSITKAMGGVTISASHNPPEDNGIKLFGASGTKLSTLIQAQIESGIRGKLENHEVKLLSSTNWGQQYYRPDLLSQYVNAMQQPFGSNKPLTGMKIVLDLAWGAAVNIAPKVFKTMGTEVIALHDVADGDRINVNCGSTHLATLKEAVVKHKADIGFAFDGDGERLMAVDAKGQSVNKDYILYHAKMVEIGTKLGEEQSGNIFSPRYSVSGDGTLTALHIAVLVKNSGKSLEQMLADSFVAYPQLLKNRER